LLETAELKKVEENDGNTKYTLELNLFVDVVISNEVYDHGFDKEKLSELAKAWMYTDIRIDIKENVEDAFKEIRNACGEDRMVSLADVDKAFGSIYEELDYKSRKPSSENNGNVENN
jgi:hypothetical protein